MKRTRKSEAAETKVRIPQRAALGDEAGCRKEAGEGHPGWRKEAMAGRSGPGSGREEYSTSVGWDKIPLEYHLLFSLLEAEAGQKGGRRQQLQPR